MIEFLIKKLKLCCYNSESIFFAASNKSFTALTDFSKFSFSFSDKFNSITFSTPSDPIITGTPA